MRKKILVLEVGKNVAGARCCFRKQRRKMEDEIML